MVGSHPGGEPVLETGAYLSYRVFSLPGVQGVACVGEYQTAFKVEILDLERQLRDIEAMLAEITPGRSWSL